MTIPKFGKKITILIAVAGIISFIGGPVNAKAFPEEEIKLVVPYPPGGSTDILARLMAESLSSSLQKPVVVLNKPGAAAMVGSTYVAQSKPDGYTLLLASSTPLVISPLTTEVPYNPIEDFTPVGLISSQELAIFANNDFPPNNIEELIKYSKENPKGVHFGTYGLGSLAQLAGILFNKDTGANLIHIPYKGSAPAMVDVVSGKIELGIDMITPVIPQHEAKKVKVYAITGSKLYAGLPGVPSINDSLADYQVSAWFGILAPAGIPEDVLAILNKHINIAVESDKVRERMDSLNMTPRKITPEDFKKLLRADIDRWEPIIKGAGLSKKK